MVWCEVNITVSAITPLPDYLAIFDMLEVIYCLIACCGKFGADPHDFLCIDEREVSPGQILVRRVD